MTTGWSSENILCLRGNYLLKTYTTSVPAVRLSRIKLWFIFYEKSFKFEPEQIRQNSKESLLIQI